MAASSPQKKPRSTGGDKAGVVHTTTSWQGPLPSPDAIQRFDTIVVNGAERIFQMAEREQAHRIQVEQIAVSANADASRAEIDAAKRGAWMGFAVSMLAISGAILTSYLGAHWSIPIALVSVPVMGAARALVLRK